MKFNEVTWVQDQEPQEEAVIRREFKRALRRRGIHLLDYLLALVDGQK